MQNKLFTKTCALKSSAYQFFKKGKYGKSKYNNIFGCSVDFYKCYIESQFKDGMTWDNHGKWHIDHIKPLGNAKNEKELISLFHYTNVQPLWAIENFKKSNKSNDSINL